MEDDQEDTNDFKVIKRKKTSSIFEINSQTQRGRNLKPKRGLPLSLKSTRSKKNACSIRTFLEKKQNGTLDGKDQLAFCPVCQLPFRILIGLTFQGHVQECVANFSESSVLCPNGINCNSMVPHHFKQYSHQQLASLRSVKIPKNKEIQHTELTEMQVKSTETHLKSSLTNSSQVPSTSSAKTIVTKSDTNSCVNNSSQNTINSAQNVERTSLMENILDAESTGETETQSSEKENLDEVNAWLNDGLKYEDFEMNSNDYTPTLPDPTNILNPLKCIPNTEITVATSSDPAITSTSTVATSNIATNARRTSNTATSIGIKSSTEKVGTESESINEIFTHSKSPETQKQLSKISRKQMDIGVYFGLKPKHKVAGNETEDVSSNVGNVLQQNKKQFSDGKSTSQNKKCPFYKIVEGTSFAVDAFSYGHVPGISAYFLSHFHYDHYGGLKRSFSKPIYCSQITANLISLKIKVAARFIHPLPLITPTVIENIEVTLLEANHCPGAVMFIFKLPNGQTHLHTGDFRASRAMQEISSLNQRSIHTLYLDTTYCDPSYSFPPQSETVEYCVSVALEVVRRNAKTLIVVGTYTIGKEKIFTAVANALQCKVAVQRDKYSILQCLESEHLKKIITRDYKEAKIHVLPMAHLSHTKLADHLESYSSQYSELLAFKPTGWTFTDSCEHDLKNIKPSKRASVTIYGVPYSEHSSFSELMQFVQFIKPNKIIPTVNNGSATRREEMKNIFKSWLRT